MPESLTIRLGTRASALARWQAEWVAARLRESGADVEMVHITTQGDVKSGPIGQFGGQGVFTKEIQNALLRGEIDLAVHSLKDLPTEHVPGLRLAGVPPREQVGDVLVSQMAQDLQSLPPGAKVGTGSQRRRAQLLHCRRDLQIEDVRGNVETRLRKLDEGHYAAIVLAEAGLRRLGLDDRITQVLPKDIMLPAVGQGALGLEVREDDARTAEFVLRLDNLETHAAVLAERSLLRTLRGGCLAPVGAWARRENHELKLEGVVLSRDGRERIFANVTGPLTQAEDLGAAAAERLFEQGAERLIAEAR